MKEKQRYILIVLVLLLSGRNTFAQSTKKIYGYVYDESNNFPLVGANIIIVGTGTGTFTDENGYFQFENLLTGTYSLTASFIGYKSKTLNNISVNKDQPSKADFYLNLKNYRLDEVVVTSTGEPDSFIGSVQLISKEDIQKNNSQSVGELLQHVPGLEIQSTGGIGSSKKISIRGAETNQVLVLIDGVKLNNQLSGTVDLSQIPTNIIERIEIYKGGSSHHFGNGAIGGAINIITKNHFSNKIKLNAGIGSFGFWKVEPTISGNYKNLSYYLSYNKIKSRGNYSFTYKNSSSKITNDIRMNSDIQSDNFFARVNYRFGKNTISANGQLFNSNRGIPGGLFSLTPYARSIISNNTFGTNYSGTFNNINIKANIVYSQSNSSYSNLFPKTAKPKFKRIPNYHYQYEVKNLVSNLTVIYIPENWYKITTGYSITNLNYKDENFRPTLKSPITKANDFSQGLFFHQEVKKFFDWNKALVVFTPVIRYDIIKLNNKESIRSEDKWSPGIGLYFSIGEKNKLSVKSSYSKSFRMPTFADLFYQDVRVEGKPELLPETGTNYEITFNGTTNFYGILSGEITLFKNIIDNLIVWKLGSFEVFRPFNTNAEISGKQFNFGYTLPNKLISFNFFQTILTPLNKSNNKTTFNKIIPYKPIYSTKIKIEFNYKNLHLNLFYRSVGKRYVTEANTVEMPPYKVFDGTLSWQVNFSDIQFLMKLSSTNITNENYQIIRNYPLPMREWRFGITISY